MPPSVLNHLFQVEHIEERFYYPPFCCLSFLEPLNLCYPLKVGRREGRLCGRLIYVELDFVHIVLFLLGLSIDFLAEVPKGFPVALI